MMKFAEKISEADVLNVTWSVPSFYANKSGERLISPWCSDATAVHRRRRRRRRRCRRRRRRRRLSIDA